MMKKNLIESGSVCLHVVDVQKSLMSKIARVGEVAENIGLLLQCAKIMGVPVLASTQYKKGLGPYVASLETLVADVPQFDKVTFSAAADPATAAHLDSLKPTVKTVILVGVETHICVYQTALGLMDQGFAVWVVADAVSSRNRADHDVGLARMQSVGASIGSTEMLIYELLGRAGTKEFKEILPFIVERDNR
ncbi:MAG: nicotinamidase-related amidase [Desulforhopalus sp.]|jgi:nicotinamidase-related amidase